MANYTVIPKDLDISSLPDNKTLALDDDEKIAFSQNTYNMFGELILKNLINSYENNLSDLTYDFAQADSFHIENGINATVNTTNDIVFNNNNYTNGFFNEFRPEGVSAGQFQTSLTSTFTIKKQGFFKEFKAAKGEADRTNFRITIKDSSNNILVQKTSILDGTNYSLLTLEKSDYSRLINANETISIIYDNLTSELKRVEITLNNDIMNLNSDRFYGIDFNDDGKSNTAFIYQVDEILNGNLNASVSDVSDTDSVALFVDSDKPNLITPTYNTSGGEVNSIDFSFSDTEAINFYGYVLYIYK